jgi:hypothetical protein
MITEACPHCWGKGFLCGTSSLTRLECNVCCGMGFVWIMPRYY